MDMITDNFRIDFKKDCVMFKVDKSTYKIPSKIYPLNNRKYQIFLSTNTTECKNEDLKHLFNACKFQLAHCYSNTEMIRQGVEYLKINADIKYFSGWVFIGNKPPMHHAWIVYNGNSVLDGSILKNLFTMHLDVKDKENFTKKEHANLMKESLARNIPNNEKFCFGKVVDPMVYVGCEDDCDHARELFRKAVEVTNGNHPSYKHMGKNNVYDYSETQKIIKGLI